MNILVHSRYKIMICGLQTKNYKYIVICLERKIINYYFYSDIIYHFIYIKSLKFLINCIIDVYRCIIIFVISQICF